MLACCSRVPRTSPSREGFVQAILPIKEKSIFINLTPHEVKVKVPDYETGGTRILAIAPEPQPARVAAVETLVGYMYGVEVSKHTFGNVENLPEPKPGVAYIVSGMVRDALEGRLDVLAPDTGKTAVRNQQGQVAYVTRLRGK